MCKSESDKHTSRQFTSLGLFCHLLEQHPAAEVICVTCIVLLESKAVQRPKLVVLFSRQKKLAGFDSPTPTLIFLRPSALVFWIVPASYPCYVFFAATARPRSFSAQHQRVKKPWHGGLTGTRNLKKPRRSI